MAEFQPNAQSSPTPGTETRAQVKYGTYHETDHTWVGMTVAQVRMARGEAWSIPSDARAYRGKDQLQEGYVVQAGDLVEFHRRMGEKG